MSSLGKIKLKWEKKNSPFLTFMVNLKHWRQKTLHHGRTECLETWIVKEKGKDQSDHLKSLVEFSEDSNFDNEIKNLKHKGFQFPMKVNIYRHETITLEAKVKLMLLTIFLMWLVTENLSTESLIVSSLRLMLRINVLWILDRVYYWIKYMRPQRHRRGNQNCPSNKLSPTLQKDGNLKEGLIELKT